MSAATQMSSITMLNNLSNDPHKPKIMGSSKTPSRLSPRVMLGVELNILKPRCGSSSANSSIQASPVLPRSGLTSSRSSCYGSDGSVSPLPVGPRCCSSESTGIENQLQAYMLWINSQLKKKPGARLIEDLRNDTRDGVAFVDLISVIAGESISGVHPVPSSYAEMRENVERVLHFMSSKKIKMHHLVAKDIVDGNLKSIMRLILALAAHYKPKSVKHSSQASLSGSGSKSPNVTGIAQGASAALTAARRTVAKAGSSFRRKGREYHHRRHYHQESSSDQYSDSDTSFHSDHPRIIPGRERGDVDGASAGSSPTSGSVYSPRNFAMSTSLTVSTPGPYSTPVSKSKSAEYISYKDSGTELEDSVFTPGKGAPMVERTRYDDLMAEYQKLATAMTTIKKDLSNLQDLLLSGQPPDGQESSRSDVVEGTTLEEQIVILRSQLQQSQTLCSDLREDLSKNKIELMQVQGIKAGLQQRIDAQETTISQLKAELLRRDFQKENFNSEQAHVSKQLKDRDKQISDLKRDIARRDQRIDHLQQELQLQISEKESATRSLKQQVKDLNERFKMVDETGTGADDLGVVRDALTSLRHCFNLTDPQQHTLDTIEQGISTLMERLPHSGSSSGTSSGQQSPFESIATRKLNFDGTGDVRRSPITAIPGSKQSSFNAKKLESPPFEGQNCTKVLYFTDSSTTPSMLTIYKRLGEITLHDFKGAFDRPGQFRYHFKALDPEFGTVKEEISNEETVIPGWEGKIVAWIEPDTGQ